MSFQISAGSNHSCAWTSPPPPLPSLVTTARTRTAEAAALIPEAMGASPASSAVPTAAARSGSNNSLPLPVVTTASVSLGLPAQLPSDDDFPHLAALFLNQQTSMHAVRERLKVLHIASELTSSSWRLFPDFGLGAWPTHMAGLSRALSADAVRSLLSPKVAALPMAQVLQKTMVQGRNYGPVVSLMKT